MNSLPKSLDLRSALLAVKEEGAAYVPSAIRETFLSRLQNEIEAGPFAPVPEKIGNVTQQVDSFVARGSAMEVFPLVRELLEDLATRIKAEGKGIKGLADWKPNRVVVQKFKPGALGITPHMDGKRFEKLVAVITTKGSAPFTLCRNRKGEVVHQWDATAGSLILLRAPGFAGEEDGRPFHTVEGPKRGHRFSIAFRMDSRTKSR